MSTPIRMPPIAPPPVPGYARPRPGTLPGMTPGSDSTSRSNSASNSGASSGYIVERSRSIGPPGFSLNLASPGDAKSAASSDGLAGGLPGLLVEQVKGVNSAQLGADAMMHSLLTGGDVNESEVLTAVQKADLAFRMLIQIRNKLMDAYREVQQIQI